MDGIDAAGAAARTSAHPTVTAIVPVIEERLEVTGTRRIETARVHIRKRVVEETRAIEVAARRDEVIVERVPIGRVVDEVRPTRQEGETTIVSVYEEVLIRQLVLKEELRITMRSRTETRSSERFVLRREEVEIERTPPATAQEATATRSNA